MTLNEFQEHALKNAIYPNQKSIDGLTYAVLGLCGECGELANKLKKSIRANEKPNACVLADELGDVLWYVAAVAKELGHDLDEIGGYNMIKLEERRQKNTIKNI